MYVGEGEALLRGTFKMARQAAPSIIFLDEVDSLAGQSTIQSVKQLHFVSGESTGESTDIHWINSGNAEFEWNKSFNAVLGPNKRSKVCCIMSSVHVTVLPTRYRLQDHVQGLYCQHSGEVGCLEAVLLNRGQA